MPDRRSISRMVSSVGSPTLSSSPRRTERVSPLSWGAAWGSPRETRDVRIGMASTMLPHGQRTAKKVSLLFVERLERLGEARKDVAQLLAESAQVLAVVAVGVQLLRARVVRALDRGAVRVARQA